MTNRSTKPASTVSCQEGENNKALPLSRASKFSGASHCRKQDAGLDGIFLIKIKNQLQKTSKRGKEKRIAPSIFNMTYS